MGCPHTQTTDLPEPAARPGRASGAAIAAARTIDELLFVPGSWLGLDAANQRVPGVRAGTLDEALDLIGRGRVATVFGRLRAGVAVVDVDMVRGQAVVAELVAWCAERDLWHLVRRSGRPGHAHVFIAVTDQRDALEAFCQRLRGSWRVSPASIDVRAAVRPLCAPHRSGTTPPLPRTLAAAGRALRHALGALPEVESTGYSRPARIASLAARTVPRAVPRKDLPVDWADYLGAGIPPAQVARWADTSRSAVESTATWHMAVAGWTADQAWLAIAQAHPRAFTKARAKGRRWWTALVWNHAVDALTAAPPAPAFRRDPDPTLLQRIDIHRGAWLGVWTLRYPDPRRHTLRRVFDVVLDRMIRTGCARVPCPQRDLVADTGLSRPTVAGALEQLHADGWLVLEHTYDPGSAGPEGRSHHVALPPRPPAGPAVGGDVPHSLPPSSFTPQPLCSPLGLRLAAHLGPRLWHLYLSLTCSPPSTTPADVARHAGWISSRPGEPLPDRAARPGLAGLRRLASAGLALCDEHGQWRGVPLDQANASALDAATLGDRDRRARIDVERAAYAAVRAGTGRWQQQRQDALRHGALARQIGARRWWASLDPAEQQRRRQRWAAVYRELPVADKVRIKTELATRRQEVGGLSEDQLHQTWLGGLSETDYHARAAERTQWYRSRDPATQRDLVAMWERHRDTWGIQRRAHSPTPMSGAARAAELHRLDRAVDAAYEVLEAGLGALSLIPPPSPSRRQESA